MKIKVCQTDEEILDCFPVLSQLRPHLQETNFVKHVRLQETESYRLVYMKLNSDDDNCDIISEEMNSTSSDVVRNKVVAVGGARIMNNFAFGKILYIDDLVVDEKERSKGHGQTLFDWFLHHASDNGCNSLQLDSGVERYGAHRFYLTNRMEIRAHRFCREVS